MIDPRGRRRSLVLLFVAWAATLVLAPLVGSDLSPAELLEGGDVARTVFWQLRLPRVLLSSVAGAMLALSGLAYQTLLRNALAEPYTIGTASGAALGAVLAIFLGGSESLLGLPLLTLASFAGAVLATLLVVGMAARERGLESSTLLLSGVAVSLTCSAFILFIQYFSDSTKTFRMVRWMMGGFSVVGYRDLLWLLPWVLAGAALLLTLRWELNLLLMGEELAASRGVDLLRLRLQVLGVTSLMIGAMVAVCGPIGFVGLMVPHMLRRWIGNDHLYLAPACLLAGGAFLTLCDLLARVVMAPAELPVGVLTALLGGPFFLWLIYARRRRM
jgi:iron complex transport system permease protein